MTYLRVGVEGIGKHGPHTKCSPCSRSVEAVWCCALMRGAVGRCARIAAARGRREEVASRRDRWRGQEPGRSRTRQGSRPRSGRQAGCPDLRQALPSRIEHRRRGRGHCPAGRAPCPEDRSVVDGPCAESGHGPIHAMPLQSEVHRIRLAPACRYGIPASLRDGQCGHEAARVDRHPRPLLARAALPALRCCLPPRHRRRSGRLPRLPVRMGALFGIHHARFRRARDRWATAPACRA